jgi:radical SAM protein with 4Fe4S-binding SPASM domain
MRRVISGKKPMIAFFELSNRCNLHCVACRQTPTEIFNQNPKGTDDFVPLGTMSTELFRAIIDEAQDHLMLAVLYVNGEPLLRQDIAEILRYASDRDIATMISTNGMLMTEHRALELLESGVDFIKIAVSGFTQQVYERNHRGGDVEAVKTNLERLVRAREKLHADTVIMLDYIAFRHNDHESRLWRTQCERLGILFNLRTGISQGRPEVEERHGGVSPATKLCDWLWKTVTINWDGSVFPCCEYATWKDIKSLGRCRTEGAKLAALWNGPDYQRMRKVHITKGRSSFPRCAGCHYQGVRPQG